MSRSLSEDVRFQVMRILAQDPHVSQRQLARQLGVSLGCVNYCMRALAEKGLVKFRNFRAADNKLRYAYVLTPAGLDAKARLANGFLRRKIAEYEALKAEISELKTEIEGDDQV